MRVWLIAVPHMFPRRLAPQYQAHDRAYRTCGTQTQARHFAPNRMAAPIPKMHKSTMAWLT
jgi:hypothetical protein